MPAWHFVMSGLPALLIAFIKVDTTPASALEDLEGYPLKPTIGLVQQSALPPPEGAICSLRKHGQPLLWHQFTGIGTLQLRDLGNVCWTI